MDFVKKKRVGLVWTCVSVAPVFKLKMNMQIKKVSSKSMSLVAVLSLKKKKVSPFISDPTPVELFY